MGRTYRRNHHSAASAAVENRMLANRAEKDHRTRAAGVAGASFTASLRTKHVDAQSVLVAQRCSTGAERLVVARKLLVADMIEDTREVLVALEVLLRDVRTQYRHPVHLDGVHLGELLACERGAEVAVLLPHDRDGSRA